MNPHSSLAPVNVAFRLAEFRGAGREFRVLRGPAAGILFQPRQSLQYKSGAGRCQPARELARGLVRADGKGDLLYDIAGVNLMTVTPVSCSPARMAR
jgi:hypothetical protein